MILSMISQVILARILGIEQYGKYTFVFSWVVLLTVPACLGLTTGSVRIVSQLRASENWSNLKGFLRVAYFFPLLSILFIAPVALLIIGYLGNNDILRTSWWIGIAFVLPLNALSSVQGGLLRGFKRPIESKFAGVTEPLVFILLLYLTFILYGKSTSEYSALVVKMIALFTSLLLYLWFLRRCRNSELNTTTATYSLREWVNISIPLLLFSGMAIILKRTDIIMLGYFAENVDVGVYAAVSRIANLTALGIAAVNTVANPLIAEYFTKSDFRSLQKITTQSARIVCASTLTLSLIVVLGWEYILMAFGTEFLVGRDSLFILAVGQLIVSVFGPLGQLLIMTKYERLSALMLFGTVVTNIIFNAILIPIWGIMGAALATTTANLLWTFVFFIIISKMLPIRLSILG